jgi:hypothetical protein
MRDTQMEPLSIPRRRIGKLVLSTIKYRFRIFDLDENVANLISGCRRNDIHAMLIRINKPSPPVPSLLSTFDIFWHLQLQIALVENISPPAARKPTQQTTTVSRFHTEE